MKFFFRKKPEIYWSGGTPPPLIGKRPIYFRFFLMKASLSEDKIKSRSMSQRFPSCCPSSPLPTLLSGIDVNASL